MTPRRHSHKQRNRTQGGSVTYPGTHDPLVTPETFEQVQTILRQNHIVGDKPQKYDHYLKGSIYCACGKRHVRAA
ncbi:MAG TPA: recombinase family protein, partial [Candidatus Agrococcus pullicola]|nr:recombinase family protein [Candidatus Agrococcus pullicola]